MMYKSAQSGAAGPGPDANGASAPPPEEKAQKDEVVDAEFVDVDDKGKK